MESLLKTFKAAALCGCITYLTAAGAQETTLKIGAEDEGQKMPQKKVEKIQVTGSHIKRIDIEGPSPVQTIDKQELDETGYNSVADVLRNVSANSFGSRREQAGSTVAGVAEVSLRGLGASSTLVLMNGRRLPTDGVTGAVDLNLIPMAAVERVEILKDGASAIYGSDAIGGVVNIITKRDYVGTEMSFQQSVSDLEGGEKTEVSLVNGFQAGRFSMTNVGHYRKNEAVFDRDREYSQDGVSPLGSPGSFRPVNPDGTFGEWQADANCPDGQRSTTQPGINGEVCTFNFADRSVRLPEIEQTSLMSDMAYELNSTTELSLRLGGSRKLANWAYAPAPGRFTVPADVADGLNLPGIPSGSDVNFGYRLTELGDRVSEIVTDAWNVQAGVKKAVGDSWDLEIYGGHNRVHRVDEGVSGYALTAVLQERIANGDFNPVGTPGARGSLQGARYVPSQITTSQLANVDIVASGEVFEMPSGPAALAIGAQYTQQSYRDRYDERSVNGEVFGSAGSSGGGSRQTQSAFTELSMPVTQKLELQVAGRYDNYSDFGSTANPKLGLRYQASKSVLLRASAGTGFQAPLMQDLYAADSLGFPNFIDRVACQNEQQAGGPTPSCNPAQYLVTSSGNDGLEEVKSQSYNVGMIVQPNRAFNFGVDAWLTQLDNVVGINYEELTRAEAAGADISSTGVTVNRNPDGSLESIDAPLQNLSRQEISGLDVTMGVRLGRFDLTIDHSHVFYFKSEGFPGAGFRDFLDQNGNPMWRNTVSLGIIPADKHRTVFIARTVAGQQKLVKQDGRIPDYTEVDMQYIWSPGKIGDITFGAANILGTTPPLDNSNPNNQLNASLYNQLGRQYYMAYSKGF